MHATYENNFFMKDIALPRSEENQPSTVFCACLFLLIASSRVLNSAWKMNIGTPNNGFAD